MTSGRGRGPRPFDRSVGGLSRGQLGLGSEVALRRPSLPLSLPVASPFLPHIMHTSKLTFHDTSAMPPLWL